MTNNRAGVVLNTENPFQSNKTSNPVTDALNRSGHTTSPLDIGAIETIANNAIANAIKPSNPRVVTITDARELTRDERADIAAIQAQIDAKKALVYQLQNPYGSIDETLAAAGVKKLGLEIFSLENDIKGIQKLAEKVTVKGLDINVTKLSNNAEDNILNGYMDVQYHISLTMISEDDAIRYQKSGYNSVKTSIDLNTLKVRNNTDKSITIASTGDTLSNNSDGKTIRDRSAIGATPVTGDNTSKINGNYYNISKLSVRNITEPSPNNPMISTMTTMKMSVVEPYGLKLHEDIKDAAIILGYTYVNSGRIIYRVDIAFSGYEPDSGAWIENIKIGGDSGTDIVSTMVVLTNMQAEVTSSGTLYELDFAPMGSLVLRPDDFVVDAITVTSGTTFRDFLTNFSSILETAKREKSQKNYTRHYEFIAPTSLLDSGFAKNAFSYAEKQITEAGDHIIASGKNIDIMTILQGAIDSTDLAPLVFNADEGNDAFITPRVMFVTRFNVIYGDKQPDDGLNDYHEITYQYIIEPFVSYKFGFVDQTTVDAYVAPENQLSRLREIIRTGMLVRVYNYIHTGKNTEVIDFDIRLKSFYTHTLNMARRSQAIGGVGDGRAANSVVEKVAERNDFTRIINESDSDNANVDNVIRGIFGDRGYDISGTRQGHDRLGASFSGGPDNLYFGSTVTPEDERRDNYVTYKDDYLKLDLVTLNGMSVRGDPVWLFNQYSNVTESHRFSPTSRVSANDVSSSLGKVIFLRMLPPDQDDIMNESGRKNNPYTTIMGGFYQVVGITSNFENGKFTQSIDGQKMDHLNYVEELFEQFAYHDGTPVGGVAEYKEPVL
jgi:hypothetical protein